MMVQYLLLRWVEHLCGDPLSRLAFKLGKAWAQLTGKLP